MTHQNDSIDRMRIASPCSVGWEKMSGDDRVRFCNQCSLHVYNISELTKQEVVSLVAETEGRICARLYRRADGSVLTRDCPVGLRALRRRVSKMAGAALTAVLGLCSGLVGQTKPQEGKKEGQECSRIVSLKMKKTVSKDGQAVFSGIVLDEMGAIISGATVNLINERTKEKFTATSSVDGQFSIPSLAAGKYSLEIEMIGFKSYKQKNLAVNSGEDLQADITLQIDGETVTVGILISNPQIQSTNGTTILSGDFLRKLPLP